MNGSTLVLLVLLALLVAVGIVALEEMARRRFRRRGMH